MNFKAEPVDIQLLVERLYAQNGTMCDLLVIDQNPIKKIIPVVTRPTYVLSPAGLFYVYNPKSVITTRDYIGPVTAEVWKEFTGTDVPHNSPTKPLTVAQLKSIAQKTGHGHTIILKTPVYDHNEVLQGYNYHYRHHFIGKGSYKEVFMAYPLNPDTGELDIASPKAAQACDRNHYNEGESKITSTYYNGKSELPTIIGNTVYFITEHLPGPDLTNENGQLNPEFRNLSFGTTLEVIHQISIAMNLLHNNTPYTGSARAHNDVKGENIKVNIQNGRVDVYPLDFGFTGEVAGPDDFIKGRVGTLLYIAPEVVTEDRMSIKADIWSLGAIFRLLLGVTNVFDEKYLHADLANMYPRDRQFHWTNFINEGYGSENLLKPFESEIAATGMPFYEIISQFLTRMELEYNIRPDSDEVLTFTTKLNSTYKLAQTYLKTRQDLIDKGVFDEQPLRELEVDIQTHLCALMLATHGVFNDKTTPLIEQRTFQLMIQARFNDGNLDKDTIDFILSNFETAASAAAAKGLQKVQTSGFNKGVHKMLNHICDSEPTEIPQIVNNLGSLDSTKTAYLNNLGNLMEKYKVKDLPHFELIQFLKDPNLKANVIYKACIERFIINKSAETGVDYNSFWFRGNKREEECIVAKKHLAKLGYQEVEFNQKDQLISSRGDLGELLQDIDNTKKILNLARPSNS